MSAAQTDFLVSDKVGWNAPEDVKPLPDPKAVKAAADAKAKGNANAKTPAPANAPK